jgi:hypothetical protein
MISHGPAPARISGMPNRKHQIISRERQILTSMLPFSLATLLGLGILLLILWYVR